MGSERCAPDASSLRGRFTGNVWGWPAALAVVIGVAAQFAYLPNDDATWLIAVARRLLHGGSLYSADLVEINPPLIIWLTTAVVMLAESLRLDPVALWRLFVGAQVAVSVWLVGRMLAASTDDTDVAVRPVVLTAIATVAACLPAWNFGQRDHLIVLWFLPYVFVSAGWLTGAAATATVRWAAGVLLALAVSLKPHYAIAVIVIEAGVAVERRSLRGLFRPVLRSALAVGVGYVLLVVIAYPAYFTVAIPLAQRYYPAYGALQIPPSHLFYVLVLGAALVAARQSGAAAIRTQVVVLAALGAYGAFVAQLKGWPYHFLPAKTLVCAALAVGFTAGGRRWLLGRVAPARQRQVAALACAGCVAGAVVLTWRQWDTFHQTRQARVIRNVQGYLAALERGHRDRRFVALSLSLFPGFPINEMLRAEWSSRFSCLWMLPAILEAEKRAAEGSEASDPLARAYLERAVCDDFDRWRPEVVLVERSRQVSALEQLLRSERFRRVWRDYRLVGRIEYFEVFERVDPARTGSASAAIQHVDAHRDEQPLAVPAAPVRLQRRAEDGALGGEAGVAPVVGAVGREDPDASAEAR
jgi:hypothetical protein